MVELNFLNSRGPGIQSWVGCRLTEGVPEVASRGQGSMKPSRQPTPKNGSEKQQPGNGERTEPGEMRGGTGLGFAAGA